MRKSERLEGQEFRHTAGGPTGYYRSAKVLVSIMKYLSRVSKPSQQPQSVI